MGMVLETRLLLNHVPGSLARASGCYLKGLACIRLAFSSARLFSASSEPGDSWTAPEKAECTGAGHTPQCVRRGSTSNGTSKDTLSCSWDRQHSKQGSYKAFPVHFRIWLTFCELWHFHLIRRNECKWGINHQIVHCWQGQEMKRSWQYKFPICCLLRNVSPLRRYTVSPLHASSPFSLIPYLKPPPSGTTLHFPCSFWQPLVDTHLICQWA